MAAINHAERGHALLSASGASRWLNCPPSARAGEKAEAQKPTSVFAEEGTYAHELSELHFAHLYEGMTKRTFNARLKKMKANDFYDEELHDHVMSYVDYVTERINDAKARAEREPVLMFEEQLDFSHIVPEAYGTGDVLVYNAGVLEIIDLKFGKGIEVSAEDNPQLKLYALGALEEFALIEDVDDVIMTIVQPRLNNISSHQMSYKELHDWARQIGPIADKAFKGEGEFNPGEHCRFCAIKATCRARADKMNGLTEDMKEPYQLTEDEISDLLYDVDEIAKWAKDIKDYAQEQAVKGKEFEGWKLVEGRSLRKYTDADAVAEALKEKDYTDVYSPPKLLTVAQLEKKIGKKTVSEIIGDLVEKPPGKPTLVPESDRRKALNSVEDDFEVIPDGG